MFLLVTKAMFLTDQRRKTTKYEDTFWPWAYFIIFNTMKVEMLRVCLSCFCIKTTATITSWTIEKKKQAKKIDFYLKRTCLDKIIFRGIIIFIWILIIVYISTPMTSQFKHYHSLVVMDPYRAYYYMVRHVILGIYNSETIYSYITQKLSIHI